MISVKKNCIWEWGRWKFELEDNPEDTAISETDPENGLLLKKLLQPEKIGGDSIKKFFLLKKNEQNQNSKYICV